MSDTTVKRRLVRDLSASTVQTGIIQVFGLLFFYVSSRFLSKDDFGEFSWSSAVAATLVAIASLGLDLIFVKRLASGKDVVQTSGIHLLHTLFSGVLVSIGVWLASLFFESFLAAHPLLVIVTIYLSFSNIANSFKLCLNGLEAYRMLARLALFGNLTKFVIIASLLFIGKFTVHSFIIAYFIGAIVEFVAGYFLVKHSVGLAPKLVWQRDDYKAFVYESMPQMGVVLFDSALARIDWILLGALSISAVGITNAAATAEYSFTYKVFEVAKLPLIIIAPVLLTRFSKLFSQNTELDLARKDEIKILFQFESFVLLLLPIVLVCVWSPALEFLNLEKYGQSNENKFWILALCIPLHGYINFMWTLSFVQNKLKKIMYTTIVSSLLNVVANIFLIPLYGGLGAAIAFLVSTVVQLVLYLNFTGLKNLSINLWSPLLMLCIAAAASAFAVWLPVVVFVRPLIAIAIYVAVVHFAQLSNIKTALTKLTKG